jgi:uncharacterized membrane protein YdjX (TVP38/TMEM64 family)
MFGKKKRIRNFIFKNLKSILLALVVIALFIASSWYSNSYAEAISASAFSSSVYAELAYFLVSILSIVIADISASPLIPLAYALWGAMITAVLTALGWTIGSVIAFWLARRFGEPLVCRLVNKCDFEDYKNNFNNNNLFWQLLLARIFLPVDVLSYAVGLFTKMKYLPFALSTLIGSFIFTFLAIYASTFDVIYQVVFGIIFLLIFFYRLKKLVRSIMVKKVD